jgi:hypothetical protein
VKVEDLEIFRVFRAAMVKFVQAADQSLSGADSDIARTRAWLEGEQRVFWESQRRIRAEAVSQAKEQVRRKKLYKDATGRYPDATAEEKHLAKCMAAFVQAEEKITAIRRAIPKLEKESGLYRAGVSRFAGTLTGEMPKALALLDRLAARLEEYVQLTAPVTSVTDSAATGFESTFTRAPGEVPPPPAEVAASPETSAAPAVPAAPPDTPAPPDAAVPSPSSLETGNRKLETPSEGGHVADGQ